MQKKCHHKLSDIVLIGLFTYLSNGEDYEYMVLFAQSNYDFVKKILRFTQIPSHDTFNRVFKHLNPSVLRGLLTDYGKDVLDILSDKQICVDGKKIKGTSPTSHGNQGLYIVNAWVAENQLHWHLDVTFREDKCRARAGFSAENLSTIRKLALQIIQSYKDKLSLKKRIVKAAYSTEYLQKIISCV